MHFPDWWTERAPFLVALEEEWEPVPKAVFSVAVVSYSIFLFQAAHGTGLPGWMDLVFVPIHEGGHLLFRFFGEPLAVAGGTLLQLSVPLMLALYFVLHRQIQGTAFCMFFFFEQFLPISVYMADARVQELPLLTVGDTDNVIHDWNYLFGKLGVLDHDTQIARIVRVIGWIGMLGTVAWMAWRSLQSRRAPQPRQAGLR